jgi:hypothetical protein
MYRNLVCKEVLYQGHEKQTKNAYFAQPEGPGPFPAVVFIHHVPGWNEVCIETVRRFAHHGFMAISMNLYAAYGEGDADDPDPPASYDRFDCLTFVEEVVGLDERLKALRPSDPEVRYNLACSLTLSRKFEQAAAELSSALELGFNDVHSLQSDPDLADLRAHPAFRPIRARLRGLKGSAEGPSNG